MMEQAVKDRILWEAERAGTLFDLEFEPDFIGQMGYLSHYNRLPLIVYWYQMGELNGQWLNQLLADS